jgi:hypothetical protein
VKTKNKNSEIRLIETDLGIVNKNTNFFNNKRIMTIISSKIVMRDDRQQARTTYRMMMYVVVSVDNRTKQEQHYFRSALVIENSASCSVGNIFDKFILLIALFWSNNHSKAEVQHWSISETI